MCTNKKVTENVEVYPTMLSFEECAKMSVKDLMEQKIAIETAMRMLKETTTVKNKYYLIGAIRSLNNGVGKGYRSEDYYANARYYTCYASDGLTDYEIKGVKNIRLINHDDKDYVECCAKITAPSGRLLPSAVYVNGVKYVITFIKSSHYEEQIDY